MEQMNLKDILKACLDGDYLTPSQEAEQERRRAFLEKMSKALK